MSITSLIIADERVLMLHIHKSTIFLDKGKMHFDTHFCGC